MLPTFLYPLQGAVYITKHRVLYNRVGNNIGRYILYAIPTLLMIYVGGWRVQREVLSALLPAGVLRGTVLQVVLAAEAVFALYILLGTLTGGLSPKVFEDVLKLRGVKEVRPLSEDEQARLKKAETVAKPLPGNPPKGFQQRMAHLGMRIAKWVLNSAVNRYLPLFTAPLLAIPVVGWILWLSLNGAAAGAEVHKPYFEKKGLTSSQQALVVKSRRVEYVAFGSVAFVLNLIPVLNYFFTLASTAGAALWAADLEASGEPLYKKQEGNTAKYK